MRGARIDRASSIVGLRDRLARELQRLGIEQWIPGEVTRDQGVRTARPDCVASNAALRAYDRARGHREVGVRDLDNGWYPLMRFERTPW